MTVANSKPKKRWFVPRFSLRLLLGFALLTSLVFGWFAPLAYRARTESRILDEISVLHPKAHFDYQRNVESDGYNSSEPPGPEFLKKWFGDNLFGHVESLEIYFFPNPEENQKALERIACFRQLKRLSIRGFLPDLSSVSKIKNLTQLTIDCDAGNIEDLGELAKLQRLYIRGELTGLSCLSKMKKLTHLTIDGGDCQSIEPLGKLKAIQNLTLRNLDVDDLSPIQNLPALEKLQLSLNQFEDHSVLTKLPNLKSLSIGHPYKGFEDWSWLEDMETLEELDLASSRVNHLPPLEKLKKLKMLNLLHCSRLASSAPVADLKNLTVLQIGNGTPMQILDTIELLPNLKNLIILLPFHQMEDLDVEDIKTRFPAVKISR